MKRTWWKIQLPKVKCSNVESKFPLKALLSLFTNHSSAGVKCNLQIPRGKHSRFEVNQSLQIPIWSATSLNLNKISETFGGKLSFDFYHIIDVLLFTVTITPLWYDSCCDNECNLNEYKFCFFVYLLFFA